MLVNCKPGCALKIYTTTASLDVETDDVVCNQCHEVIPNIPSFTKTAMKSNKDYYKRARVKPTLFSCLACGNKTEVDFQDDIVKGKGCQGNCSITIPKPMITAMKMIAKNKSEEEEGNG